MQYYPYAYDLNNYNATRVLISGWPDNGLTDLESENDERFGEERLNSFLIDHCEFELEHIIDTLKSELIEFKKDKEFYDDISYFVFKH